MTSLEVRSMAPEADAAAGDTDVPPLSVAG